MFFSYLIFSLFFSCIKSTVTGEHTCMVLKPLNNDEIEANESSQLGFFGPFYQGKVFTFNYFPVLSLVFDSTFMIHRFQVKVY